MENVPLEDRRKFSSNKLETLKGKLQEIEELKKHEGFCVYVTGSFGRREATKYSDLDLFFLSNGSADKNGISRLSKTLIDADLIRLLDGMGFPPFSNDGEFLNIHYVEDIKSELGSRTDLLSSSHFCYH